MKKCTSGGSKRKAVILASVIAGHTRKKQRGDEEREGLRDVLLVLTQILFRQNLSENE